MNKLSNFLFILLSVVSCRQQNQELNFDEPQTYSRIWGKQSIGFINQNGDTIIPLNKYRILNPIDEEGMILGEYRGKRGYINIAQETLIPFKYENLSVFSNGLAPAKLNGKFGFIDRKGKIKIPFKYEQESHFYLCNLAGAKLKNKYGFIDKKGNTVIPIEYEDVRNNQIDSLVCVMQDGKWAFFSCSGVQMTDFRFDQITESYYDRDHYTYFKRGLCRVQRDGQFAYINKKFKEIVPFGKFSTAEPFRNYLGIVSKNGKIGIIDTLGHLVVPLKYDFIEHPTEYSNESDLFILRKGKHLQLLNKNADPITDLNLREYIWDSYRGEDKFQRYFVLTNSSGLVGTVSDDGIEKIPFKYEMIEPFDGKSVTYARLNGKYGLVDYTGQIIYPFEYDEIVTQKFFDYFIINSAGKYGMVDEKGKQIVSFAYQSIAPMSYDNNKRFMVQRDQLFGVIDQNENIIIPIEFDEISNWVEYGPREHFITKNGKKGLISRDGKIVIPPIYDEIWVDNSKLIKVEKNGLYGTVDWKNKIVHPIKFKEIFWEWPYMTNKPMDTVYLKENIEYFSTDIEGKILERKVNKERL